MSVRALRWQNQAVVGWQLSGWLGWGGHYLLESEGVSFRTDRRNLLLGAIPWNLSLLGFVAGNTGIIKDGFHEFLEDGGRKGCWGLFLCWKHPQNTCHQLGTVLERGGEDEHIAPCNHVRCRLSPKWFILGL